MTIEQRVQLLHMLYEEWAKGSQILERDVLMRRMNVTWDAIRHEVAYLEENEYIEIKKQYRGARIFERMCIATKGIKLVEDGLAISLPQGFQSNVVHNTSQVDTWSQTEDFDVFLCYNKEDRIRVKKIAENLKEQGILPWFDEWELRPGLPWQRALEVQIKKIKSLAVFVGKAGLGPWNYMEIEAFIRQFVKRNCPVIPVLLIDAPLQPDLPLFLEGMEWVDFHKNDPDPMDRLIWGITGERLQT